MEGAPLLSKKAPGQANRSSKSNWLFHAVQLLTAAGVVAILVAILYKSTRVDVGLVPNLLLNAPPSSTSGPVVEISNGPVRGTTLTSRSGRVFNAFYQLPYAEPPVGKLRFQVYICINLYMTRSVLTLFLLVQAPRPYSLKWEGIRDASQRGGSESACVQSRGIDVEGKEDCLLLSVFTPQVKIPVLMQRFVNIIKVDSRTTLYSSRQVRNGNQTCRSWCTFSGVLLLLDGLTAMAQIT